MPLVYNYHPQQIVSTLSQSYLAHLSLQYSDCRKRETGNSTEVKKLTHTIIDVSFYDTEHQGGKGKLNYFCKSSSLTNLQNQQSLQFTVRISRVIFTLQFLFCSAVFCDIPCVISSQFFLKSPNIIVQVSPKHICQSFSYLG